jgi:hypothetical protein
VRYAGAPRPPAARSKQLATDISNLEKTLTSLFGWTFGAVTQSCAELGACGHLPARRRLG